MTEKQKLIILVGPTASGKTSTAIYLAKIFNLEVISADSRYLYKGLDIGTAKPTQTEMDGIPHHLIDVTDLNHIWHLAIYKERVSQCINEIYSRGSMPILVGGTGQYIKSIVEGWQIPIQEPDEKMRDLINLWGYEIGSERLHAVLALLDPAAAQKIDHQNQRRTVRALEVIFKTGHRFSEQRTRSESQYINYMIGIDYPRDALYHRIDQRIEQMLEKGFLAEVQSLLDNGYEMALRKIAAIGYVELIDYLEGMCTLDEAVMLMKRRSRILVRRQSNWFKRTDQNVHWFCASSKMLREMSDHLRTCGIKTV